MTTSRRDFFLKALHTSGAVAAVALMKQDGLMALPSTVPLPSGDWYWDGTPEAFLKQLNLLTAQYLFRDNVRLKPHDPQAGTSGDWYMAGAAFEIHMAFKVCEKRRPAIFGEQMVFVGNHACASRYDIDPIASVNELARQFAEVVTQNGCNTIGPLALPHAMPLAVSQGVFRLVQAYDTRSDLEMLRIDTLLGKVA